MEHPCYKCGASVEDGIPFCPRCSAPQIRVAGAEPAASIAASPEAVIEQYASNDAPQPTSLAWHHALPSAGIALFSAFFLMRIGTPAGLGMLAAGFLSVVLYRRRIPGAFFTPGMGVRLGGLTGLLGFGVLVTMFALWTAFHSGKELHDEFLKYIQQYAAHSSDPHMQQVLDLFNTPEGFTFIMVLGLIVSFVAFVIFAGLGGAIGAFLLHRKQRP